VSDQSTIRASDLAVALMLGTAATLSLLPPWCGFGWGGWLEWLCAALAGLAIALRFVWSR
jgi:hypothetical protein